MHCMTLALASFAYAGVALADPLLGPVSGPDEIAAWNPDFSHCPPSSSEPITRRLAVVISTTNAPSRIDAECSMPSAYLCLTMQHIPAGSVVLAGNSREGHTCVTYRSGERLAHGWVPASQIKERAVSLPAFSDWIGDWQGEDVVLFIRKSTDGTLMVRRDRGLEYLEDDGVFRYPPVGFGTPAQAHLFLQPVGEPGCYAEMDLLGPYLVVYDVLCKKLGVEMYGGIFRKQPSHKK